MEILQTSFSIKLATFKKYCYDELGQILDKGYNYLPLDGLCIDILASVLKNEYQHMINELVAYKERMLVLKATKLEGQNQELASKFMELYEVIHRLNNKVNYLEAQKLKVKEQVEVLEQPNQAMVDTCNKFC